MTSKERIESGPELLMTPKTIKDVPKLDEFELNLYTERYLRMMKEDLYQLQTFDPLRYHNIIDHTCPERMVKNIALILQETHRIQESIRDLANQIDYAILKYEHRSVQEGNQML